jgi:gas vesicle structural protein
VSEHLPAGQQDVTLLELVDRVLNKGVVLTGDITLSVADVDLVYVGLRVLISSVEAAQRLHGGGDNPPGGDALQRETIR